MRSLLALSAFFVVVSGGLLLTLEGPKWIPALAEVMPGRAGGSDDRVLVFLVGAPDGVERVRRSVHPSRVVHASETAIALREGRVVAAGQEAAGESIMAAGWIDREIEIFTVARRDILPPKASGAGGLAANKDVDPERLERLGEIMKQDTLSYGEQLFVLQAMNDGVVF